MQPEKLQEALTEHQREAGLYLESQTMMCSSPRGTIRFWRLFPSVAQRSKAYGKKLSGGWKGG